MREDERTKRALVFGEVAELYDRARPSYPDALIDDVLAAMPDASTARVLEVGAGTGKATMLLAPKVHTLVALEPDPAMAAIASRHAEAADNVDIVVDRFEDWVTAGPVFDAVVAAHCWHWVDPRVGYAKARSLLSDDGVLAAFWNVPVPEISPLAPAIDEAYAAHAPSLEDKTSSTRKSFTNFITRHPGFRVREKREYDWDEVYTSREYTDMLCTHSDHHLLPEPERAALVDAVARIIDDAGGTMTLRYETVLVMLEPE
ncbi:MAG: class I SAM-dependent methyltransferase [Acidimicrobiia bacterium]